MRKPKLIATSVVRGSQQGESHGGVYLIDFENQFVEQHVDWIANCIAALDCRGATSIEPDREAEDAWVAHTNEIAQYTLYWSCSSW